MCACCQPTSQTQNERRMPGPHSHSDTEPENVAAYLRLKAVREGGPGRTRWQKSRAGGFRPRRSVMLQGSGSLGIRLESMRTRRGGVQIGRGQARRPRVHGRAMRGLHVSGRHRERQCMPHGRTIAPSERGTESLPSGGGAVGSATLRGAAAGRSGTITGSGRDSRRRACACAGMSVASFISARPAVMTSGGDPQ